jgi:hypothetical protein
MLSKGMGDPFKEPLKVMTMDCAASAEQQKNPAMPSWSRI